MLVNFVNIFVIIYVYREICIYTLIKNNLGIKIEVYYSLNFLNSQDFK